MFAGPFGSSIVKRALVKKLVRIKLHYLRQWALDKRGTVDDRVYGGGTGMLLRPEPIFDAVKSIQNQVLDTELKSKVVLLDAGGKPYNQKQAVDYSKLDQLILICGHYEGIDYRVHEYLADGVVSIGNFVVTGGEIPAMLVTDSVVRLIPGVLEKEEATKIESFAAGEQLEYPQYTRPEEYRGYKVPKVLLSGNHGEIDSWRRQMSIKRTKINRPGLGE